MQSLECGQVTGQPEETGLDSQTGTNDTLVANDGTSTQLVGTSSETTQVKQPTAAVENISLETVLQEQHVLDTLSRAGLSVLERQAIEAAMEPFHGWQTEFAKTDINPATNKPYSRMRITQVLEMAQEKVAKTLKLQEAA